MNFNNQDSCVVIEFNAECEASIKDWLTARLKSAGLGTQVWTNSKDQENFLIVSCDKNKILEGAEEIGLKKTYHNGEVRDFLVDDLVNFVDSDDPDRLFSQAERLKIIEYYLNNLKLESSEIRFDSSLNITQHDGIINQLRKSGLVKNVFPLHDKETMKRLEHVWYKDIKAYSFFKSIPIEQIRNYFGESIAIYFRFFEFYTKALYSFAFIGLVTWLLPISSFHKFIICAISNLIWNTVFTELWKRKSNELCYHWGMFDLELTDRPRPEFHGTPGVNPITKRPELIYSKKLRTTQKYLISYPMIALAIFIAFIVMMIYYYVQNKVDQAYTDDSSYVHSAVKMLPSIVYSCVVIPLNLVYKEAAIRLTNWENHRTQSSYESNLTTKLFVFYFANNFMTLFYEAFFIRSYANITNILISLMTVNALFNQFSETLLPYLLKKHRKKKMDKENACKDEIEKQAFTLDPYEGTYSDYVTLFEQYGYLTLFSSVFPWVAVAALINNIAEQRSDAFKYCHVNQRPFPRNASNGIGPWKIAFELLSLISVMTNMALIALHPDVRDHFSYMTDTEYYMYLVAAEHALILIKVVLMTAIPDEAAHITQAKQRHKFESLEAFKKERLNSRTSTKL